ncbi:hypothetical protein [Paraburkholderia sp. MM5384-R2]|uniref:hypothetical protein n=1 Tax=Paraburkholderia sp. MM5384-R2 TaxID=2723097 RepID=UPI00161F0529|nr:hypothetical protein [Paraburkholderia sp. MM5384-R2]
MKKTALHSDGQRCHSHTKRRGREQHKQKLLSARAASALIQALRNAATSQETQHALSESLFTLAQRFFHRGEIF